MAANIVSLCGIGKSTVSRVMRELQKEGVIYHTETREKKDEWPSKIFKINRNALHILMNPKSDVTTNTRLSWDITACVFSAD